MRVPASKCLAREMIEASNRNEGVGRRRRGMWGWVAVSLLIAVIVVAAIEGGFVPRAGALFKGRRVQVMGTRLESPGGGGGFQCFGLKGLGGAGGVFGVFC